MLLPSIAAHIDPMAGNLIRSISDQPGEQKNGRDLNDVFRVPAVSGGNIGGEFVVTNVATCDADDDRCR